MADSISKEILTKRPKSSKEELGDRIKQYESKFTGPKIDPSLPFVMRLDGHAFSKFTGGLKKPYDYNFCQAFINTAIALIKEYKADTVYTHSDEISLLFYPKKQKNSDTEWREPHLGGRIQKIITLAAGFATMIFNKELVSIFTGLQSEYPENTYKKMTNYQAYFDCRIFQLPNDVEMFSYMYWRSKVDCVRNNAFLLSRRSFTKGELENKSTKERIAMLAEKGVKWEDEPSWARHGTFIKRVPRNTTDGSVRYDFKVVEVDLKKYNEEINEVLKCEVYVEKKVTVESRTEPTNSSITVEVINI